MPVPPLPSRVTIVEVGPRDGLQNEPTTIDTAHKIALVDGLADAGLPVIEVTAFVNPRRVPQMGDAEQVLRGIRRRPGTRYTALVPNLKGLERAAHAPVDEVAIFAAASNSFSLRNIGQNIESSLATYGDVTREAARSGLRVRGYLSTSFGCPFEGAIDPRREAELTSRLLDLGVYEVALSDTIGVAHPGLVGEVVDACTQRGVALEALALHLHDTRGTALANVFAGLLTGITTFDSSAGGLGGCPFAPGATGNLATEDLVYMLDGLGVETGTSLQNVVAASAAIEAVLGHALPSRYYRAAQSGRR